MHDATDPVLTACHVDDEVDRACHLLAHKTQRRVTFVSEVVGMESDIITMQDLFSFHSKGEAPDGKLFGEFKWSGIMPRFLRRVGYYGEGDRLSRALGVKLPKM